MKAAPPLEIERLYAVVGINPPHDDQTIVMFGSMEHDRDFEGIAAVQIPGVGFMPMVAAGEQALERLRMLVENMRKSPNYDGRELRIVRFARAEVIEVMR